jgi:hypothetical protein
VESSRFESIALIGAVIGAAVLGSQVLAIGTGAAALGDIAILLSLFAFDAAAARSGGQSLAFAGAAGFCLLAPFNVLADAISPPASGARPYWLITFVWIVATVILFAVDRFRMSSREAVGLGGGLASGLAGPVPAAPISFSPVQQATYRPAPIRVEPTPPPPVPQSIVVQPPAPAPVPIPQPVFASAVMPAPEPVTQVVAAAPDVTAIPPGREALIYLNLVGEGLNVLRTVRAENLGRDYYRIADIMPEGEQWEFTPGQVVRCRKKSLSNGKHMVAYEEAPRVQ